MKPNVAAVTTMEIRYTSSISASPLGKSWKMPKHWNAIMTQDRAQPKATPIDTTGSDIMPFT